MPRTAPYGSWTSPVTLERLVENTVGLSFPVPGPGAVYWTELRPNEQGRQVLVRAGNGTAASAADVFGPEFHARTLAHEYGGLCYAVHADTVYFSNYSDQRLYRVRPGEVPEPITGPPPRDRSVRFAAPVVTPDGRWLVAVRERHPEPDVAAGVVNDVVVLATEGSGEPQVLAQGHDFYNHVALSPDARRLCWVSWDHPDMPWDATELWEAELDEDCVVTTSRRVAGGPDESAIQPRYTPEGALVFISDRTGWWNLYAAGTDGAPDQALAPMSAELGMPDWVFGASSYCILADGSIVATWSDGGLGRLGVLTPGARSFEQLATPWTTFAHLRATHDGAGVLAVAGSASEPSSVVRVVPRTPNEGQTEIEVLKRGRPMAVDPGYLSAPEAIEFPTEHGRTAHCLYYAASNPDFVGVDGELPPLIVRSHGGPTSAATSVLDYGIQFWTSRGFAVADVNYGGSTGYGREYRNRLRGAWGVVDVDDCVNAARFLAASGRVDGRRLLIHGGSAGGYTTLCAVTFTDAFAAGASYFGVADAGALARETHKFESHYTDRLIGPWPETEELYRARSAVFHADMLRTPLILFQGLEDKIVPPDQAEEMVRALDEKGVPHAYVAYEGEQHGFRRAENVKRTAEAELYFFGRVLGFTPADDLRPVEIVHEDRLPSR